MFAHLKVAVGTLQLLPHAMHVHRVRHHGVVMKIHTQTFVRPKMDGRRFPKCQTIERPRIAFHVAGKMQFDVPARITLIQRTADGVQIGISEHAPTVITQPDAGVVQIGSGRIDTHIDTGTVFAASMVHSGCFHCHATVLHLGHMSHATLTHDSHHIDHA